MFGCFAYVRDKLEITNERGSRMWRKSWATDEGGFKILTAWETSTMNMSLSLL